jgi:hypothetical protein
LCSFQLIFTPVHDPLHISLYTLLALLLRLGALRAQIPLRLALCARVARSAGGARHIRLDAARGRLGIDELLLLLIEQLVVVTRTEAVRIPHLFGVVGADLVDAHELHEGGEQLGVLEVLGAA